MTTQADAAALPVEVSEQAFSGWRCWFVLPGEGLLRPILKRGLSWTPRQAQEAVCPENAHDAPAEGCGCGIYAVCHPMLMAEVHWDRYPPKDVPPLPGVIVVGQVALWGGLIQHERGWRAQFAYPTHLYAFTEDAGLAERLRQRYAVPVTWGAEAEDLRRLLPLLPPNEKPVDPVCQECQRPLDPLQEPDDKTPFSHVLWFLVHAGRWPEAMQEAAWGAIKDEHSRPTDRVTRARQQLKVAYSSSMRQVARRHLALAFTEQRAVEQQSARLARRALWVRLVRTCDGVRKARADEARYRAWLEEVQADLARGTTRWAGRGRPYAPSTLAGLRSNARRLEWNLQQCLQTLQTAPSLPSYREWCAMIAAADPGLLEDETVPAAVPRRDWHRLIVRRRNELAIQEVSARLRREETAGALVEAEARLHELNEACSREAERLHSLTRQVSETRSTMRKTRRPLQRGRGPATLKRTARPPAG